MTLGQYRELRDALRDALEGLQEMRPYIPDYFVEKWDLDDYIDDAQAALAEADQTMENAR